MKTVPLNDNSGSIPLRASRNPVLGVFRHHCGELASVHQPKGRRSGTRYLICDKCGTDQCGGQEYQAEIKAKTYYSIEALQAAENAVHTVNEPLENEPSVLTDNLSDNLTEKLSDDKPTGTTPNAVPTANQASEINQPVLSETLVDDLTLSEPLQNTAQATPNAVKTVESIPKAVEHKPNVNNQRIEKDVKPLRIGIAAVLGGLLGAALAVVA